MRIYLVRDRLCYVQFVVVLLRPLLSRGRVMLHSVMLLCLHNSGIGDNTNGKTEEKKKKKS